MSELNTDDDASELGVVLKPKMRQLDDSLSEIEGYKSTQVTLFFSCHPSLLPLRQFCGFFDFYFILHYIAIVFWYFFINDPMQVCYSI